MHKYLSFEALRPNFFLSLEIKISKATRVWLYWVVWCRGLKGEADCHQGHTERKGSHPQWPPRPPSSASAAQCIALHSLSEICIRPHQDKFWQPCGNRTSISVYSWCRVLCGLSEINGKSIWQSKINPEWINSTTTTSQFISRERFISCIFLSSVSYLYQNEKQSSSHQ